MLRRFHRILTILLAALLLAALFGCRRSDSVSGESEALIAFDFSDAQSGVPAGWSVNSYEGGYASLFEDGAVGFTVNGYDDCRLVHTVEITPGASYVFSAEIRTEDVFDGEGATLSVDNFAVDGSFIYSDGLFGTNGWTPVVLAFRTAKTQNAVTLALRLGGYSNESSGSVWFKNVRLEQTDNAPVPFQNLTPYEATDDEHEDRTEEDYEAVFTVIFWVGAIAAIVLLFGVTQRAKRLVQNPDQLPHKTLAFWMLVLAGLVIRFILCAKFKGHSTDMSCWIGWGSTMAANGPGGFYQSVSFCDYPPLYMLILGLLYRIASLFPEGAVRLFVYMLPAFLCDILSGLLLLNNAKRFALSDRLALLLAGLIVLNPAAVYLSGAWGQIDSILTVMLIGTFLILNASREKPYYRVFAGILYAAAILMKWQALIFGPVLALMYLMTGIDQYRTKKFWQHVWFSVAAVAAALLVLLACSEIFRGDMEFLWLVDRYRSASGTYDYASVEAYNFLTLFGGNWTKAGNPMFGSANAWKILVSCIAMFSKVALLIGFPTLISRAWKAMRERTEKEPNRAFYELLMAAIGTGLLALLAFVAKNAAPTDNAWRAVLEGIGNFPLYGLWMLGVLVYTARRERGEQKRIEWIRTGGTGVTGYLTMLAAVIAFLWTFLLGAVSKLFGTPLTWQAFGVIGIVCAGLLTLLLFVIYWQRHRKANYSLYTNRGLIFLLAGCFCVWVFTFGHYMHERYIFPALFLLVFAYAYDRDPKKLTAISMLTVTTFMNEMMAMFVVSDGAKDLIRGGVVHNEMIALISLLEVGAALYLTASVFRSALAFDPGDPTAQAEKRETPQKPPRRPNGKRR